MTAQDWLQVPIGVDSAKWVTRNGCRTVLAVVHTVTSGQRLLEAVELLETDARLQVVFTQAPDTFSNGVVDFLRSTEGVVIPWQQAIREQFDLALAAAWGGLHQLHAPLMVMPHGAGFGKSFPTGTAQPIAYGLDAQRLTHDGAVIARAVVLAHDSHLDILRRQCPEAIETAVVAGDSCYDRLLASLPQRDAYRHALGVGEEHELIVVSSTWGRESLFARQRDLLPRLLAELPAERFRIATLMHPAVWFGHGPRQIRAWLAECQDAGLVIVGPEMDWRGSIVAADYVIGDHGSVPVYAAAIGRPVLQIDIPAATSITDQSGQAVLQRTTVRLDLDRGLLPQLQDAVRVASFEWCDAIAASLTSRPGRASSILRSSMYGLLELAEPGRHRRPAPVPVTGRR